MNDLAVRRTLAAIVMADVVGYSRMMGEDEAGTLQRLTRYRADFIDPTIAAHRGRIVNAVGDSLLLEFTCVVDATLCAIALQQGLADRNASLAESRRILFRIGVNLGDVIIRDRTLFGDGVNITARLQTLAEPGGICLSSAAHEQVRGKIDAAFADWGSHQVKNISHPVGVFALTAETIGALQRQAPPKASTFRRRALLAGAAACAVACGVGFAAYAWRHTARQDLGTQLGAVLSATQARLNDRSRAKLIEDYFAIGQHRAFAIAPKAQSRWWTGDWPTSASAEEKALERCQIAFNEPCELAARDESMVKDDELHVPRDMARVRYAGDFDPAQIPGVRGLVGSRADVSAYLQAPEPKAAAIHPRGLISIVTTATTQRRAETQALKLCNDNDARREADGPCFLYAIGNKVVLPQRLTAAVSRP